MSQCQYRLQPIINNDIVCYKYCYCCEKEPVTHCGTTNTVVSNVVNLCTEKTADKSRVIVGDTIAYTVNIINNSTVSVNNLFFIDTIPTGTSFVTNSFSVVGYGPVPGADPNYGVDLTTIVGTLGPSATCAITFSIVFNQVPCPRQIMNSAKVYYNY